MKEITKYSRLASYLEKLYDKLNKDFFDGELDRPVITIQSTPKAYGHYTLHDAWSVKGEGHREINIGAGTLHRPIESTICTLMHEMCHQYNQEILNVQDCSRGGTYHNKLFAQSAVEHGLNVSRTEKYGWSHTAPGDELLDWILSNDIQDIYISRNDFTAPRFIGGTYSSNGGAAPLSTTKTSHSRRYICPVCGTIIRATKAVNVLCGDCMEPMEER